MEKHYIIPPTSYSSTIVWSSIFGISFIMVTLLPFFGLVFAPTLLAIIPALWIGWSVYTTRRTHIQHLSRFLAVDFDTTLTNQEVTALLSLSEGGIADVIGSNGRRLRVERSGPQLIVRDI